MPQTCSFHLSILHLTLHYYVIQGEYVQALNLGLYALAESKILGRQDFGIGLEILDATYIDLSMFPKEFTELGWFMNITAICYSHKVVGQHCKRYDKGLIKNNEIYQKNMKRLREENIVLFDYLPFILNKTLFQSFVKNGDDTYPLEEWSGKLIGKKACGDRAFYFSSC